MAKPIETSSLASASDSRQARTMALQVLYEVDSVDHPLDKIKDRYFEDEDLSKEVVFVAVGLIDGVLENKITIDTTISEFAPAWPVSQLGIIERNVLRLSLIHI